MIHAALQRQRGATLVVALIFLVILSLLAVAAFNGTNTNLRVVANNQARDEATAAAQVAIENTISSALFTTNPDGVEANPVSVDIDNDGTVDYTARMTPKPTCYRYRAIKTSELDPAKENDRQCMQTSVLQNAGIEMPNSALVSDASLCANTEWNLRAEVEDARTHTKVAVNQGVGVRVIGAYAEDYCN